jgi:origin recognition complex subunit 1
MKQGLQARKRFAARSKRDPIFFLQVIASFIRARHANFDEYEMYITPGTDLNPLASINDVATIMSEQVFNKKYPTGKIPRKSKDFGRTFICRRGCNTQSATYTEEFIWEDVQRKTEEDIDELVNWIESATKSAKKRKAVKRTKADDDFTGGPIDDEELELETPRKKQKHSDVSTPRKIRTPSKLLTPSHKR